MKLSWNHEIIHYVIIHFEKKKLAQAISSQPVAEPLPDSGMLMFSIDPKKSWDSGGHCKSEELRDVPSSLDCFENDLSLIIRLVGIYIL